MSISPGTSRRPSPSSSGRRVLRAARYGPGTGRQPTRGGIMRRIPVRRPTPGLVVGCVALAIALGGTSFAAAIAIPRQSVGTLQLKNSAVTTKKLAGNAVTSAKVLNGSLLASDFKA